MIYETRLNIDSEAYEHVDILYKKWSTRIEKNDFALKNPEELERNNMNKTYDEYIKSMRSSK